MRQGLNRRVVIWGACLACLVACSFAQDTEQQTLSDVDCFNNPSKDGCSSYMVPSEQIVKSIDTICRSEPMKIGENVGVWFPGCSVAATCKVASDDVLCSNLLGVLLGICKDASSDSEECAKYAKLCGNGSKVPGCEDGQDGLAKSIPLVKTVYDATIDMCNAMPDMVGCETCKDVPQGSTEMTKIEACPDPLKSLSTVCYGMYMAGCEIWVDFCQGIGKNEDRSLSDQYCTDAVNGDMNMDMSSMEQEDAKTLSSDDACIKDPTSSSCATYTLPEDVVQKDLDNLCIAMPNMVGCSLRSSCVNGTANGDLCAPFTLLGTICEEMSGMRDCANYNNLCSTPGSKVQQCTQVKPVPNAPTTQEATESVLSMCSTHGMLGCEDCTSLSACPHPFDTLSEICLGMPTMAGCQQFFSMCEAAQSTFQELCGKGESYKGLPPMRMWLHSGITDIVLIKEWVPTDGWYYFGTLVACFFGALLVQYLKAWKIQVEIEWAAQRPLVPCRNAACGIRPSLGDDKEEDSGNQTSSRCCSREASTSTNPEKTSMAIVCSQMKDGLNSAYETLFGWCRFTKPQFQRNTIRSVFAGIIVFLDYMLMLIVMTFNIGIIIAVVLGFMVGALLLGHTGERAGSITPGGATSTVDPADELDVRFMEAPSCCGTTML